MPEIRIYEWNEDSDRANKKELMYDVDRFLSLDTIPIYLQIKTKIDLIVGDDLLKYLQQCTLEEINYYIDCELEQDKLNEEDRLGI